MASVDASLLLQIARAGLSFQQHIVDVLTQYEQTGQLPNGGLAGAIADVASPRKRGKKPKLNKDGSEKQPRKPTAYNAWMQAKLKELKEAVGHDPDQKHVDTFKQAAHIWAELPKEEKDRINAEFRDKQKDAVPAVGGNAAEADAALDAAGEEDDDDDNDDEEEGAVAPAAAAAPESSSEDSSDEEEPPAPAPKPKPAPPPLPVTPNTDAKKKKKRKQVADLPPVKTEASAPAADGDKQKKKKKKKDATA